MPANDERPAGESPLQDLRQGCNLLIALVHAVSAPLEPWLRVFGTVGCRVWGMRMGAGLVGIVVVPALLGVPGDPRPLVWFFLGTLGLMVVHRVALPWRERQGWVIHSRYTGLPWLCHLFPNLDEVKTKTGTEPVLVCAAGFLAMAAGSLPLGVWLVVAGLCLMASAGITEEQQLARVRAVRDAMIEQSVLMGQVRGYR